MPTPVRKAIDHDGTKCWGELKAALQQKEASANLHFQEISDLPHELLIFQRFGHMQPLGTVFYKTQPPALYIHIDGEPKRRMELTATGYALAFPCTVDEIVAAVLANLTPERQQWHLIKDQVESMFWPAFGLSRDLQADKEAFIISSKNMPDPIAALTFSFAEKSISLVFRKEGTEINAKFRMRLVQNGSIVEPVDAGSTLDDRLAEILSEYEPRYR